MLAARPRAAARLGLRAGGRLLRRYLFLFYRELATRPGQPTRMDLVVAVTGLVLLLEATRRALGLPMVIVALVFLGYTFGSAPTCRT
jgi:TRAP-type uncharacterized transport system fused permease subunit